MKAGKNNRPVRGRTAPRDDETFDASPENPTSANKPKDLRQSTPWKSSTNWFMRMWARYLNVLSSAFNKMNRFEQETWITRFCYVITIGISLVILQCFYSLLLIPVRVFALPLMLAAGWYVGTRIVAPAMIERLKAYMHDEDDY
ncbi:MAG: hypothetical protein IPI39_02325 [Candidatus Obscuribacter sp.]|nr:hypothetical protein [Candidatus Obscuribacter sp.]